ncbi:MAG: endonuclease [Bacteroidetes bacterium]|nr:endonuclease [Bacteroidota bacterium]
MKTIFTFLISTFFCVTINAQTPPPGLEDGVPFRNWLKANFHTDIFDPLTYSQAREKMYSYTENFNDTVECIYSGYKRYNPRGNGVSVLDPINTEHSVPQSYYNDSEPMRSDMHILFPAYDDWNSLRSNYKYKEIPDNETDQWILNTSSTGSIPSSNIDAYSEFDNKNFDQSWEPREIRKGDIARAVFYFYTMYPNYDMQVIGDRATFCNWHENDLPDAREISRNAGIISFQRNTNPFIDHPEWANNAWGCNVQVNSTDLQIFNSKLSLYPNPASDLLQIEINDWENFPILATFLTLDGKTVYQVDLVSPQSMVELNHIPNAAYIVSFKTKEGKLLGNSSLVVE